MTKSIIDEDQIQMTFGQAIAHLKDGQCVARLGWNGKGMFIFLVKGRTYTATAGTPSAEIFGVDAPVENLPHIDMVTADGSVCIGWLASGSDMLADDWVLVE